MGMHLVSSVVRDGVVRRAATGALACALLLSAAGGCTAEQPPARSAADADARLGGAREVPRASDTVRQGEAKLAAGDAQAAKVLFERAISEHPQDPRAHLDLGIAQEMLGDRSGAEATYRRAIALKPDLAEALNNLGVLRREAGELPEAIELLRRATAANPESASAQQNLALALEDAGDGAGAKAAYEASLTIEPESVMTRVNYGLLLVALGDRPQAQVQLSKAQGAADGNRPALLAIGNGQRQLGDGPAAVAALQLAIAAGDGSPTPALLAELALAQRLADDRAGAIASLEQALELDSSYATAHYLLGNLQAASKAFGKAERHYQAYLKLAPDGPQAARARERLSVVRKLRQ